MKIQGEDVQGVCVLGLRSGPVTAPAPNTPMIACTQHVALRKTQSTKENCENTFGEDKFLSVLCPEGLVLRSPAE